MSGQDQKLDLAAYLEDGKSLTKRLFDEYAQHISNEINKLDAPPNDRNAVAREALFSSARLAYQVIDTTQRGHLLLALIGLRTIVEQLIDVRYIFAHPAHQGDLVWQLRVATLLFNRTNDPNAQKSRLDGKGIRKRAVECNVQNIYDTTYASLVSYSHPNLRSLMTTERFDRDAPRVVSQALCIVHDTCDLIAQAFGVPLKPELEQLATAFRDRCPRPFGTGQPETAL